MELNFRTKIGSSNKVVIDDTTSNDDIQALFNALELNEERFFIKNDQNSAYQWSIQALDPEEEFQKYVSAFRYYPEKPKLLGGASDDDDSLLPEESKPYFKSIVENSYLVRENSTVLLKIFQEHLLIKPDTTYEDVIKDKKFNKALINSIAKELPSDPRSSKWGLGIVSDFQLYVNMGGEVAFMTKMNELRIFADSDEYVTLRKNRSNIRYFVTKLKEHIINCWELDGTPDKVEERKRKREEKTKEDLENEIQAVLKQSLEKNLLNVVDDIVQQEHSTAAADDSSVVDSITQVPETSDEEPVVQEPESCDEEPVVVQEPESCDEEPVVQESESCDEEELVVQEVLSDSCDEPIVQARDIIDSIEPIPAPTVIDSSNPPYTDEEEELIIKPKNNRVTTNVTFELLSSDSSDDEEEEGIINQPNNFAEVPTTDKVNHQDDKVVVVSKHKPNTFLGRQINRKGVDFYATPECAVKPLYHYLEKHQVFEEDKQFIVWECASGDSSAISNYFSVKGHIVLESDVRTIDGIQTLDFTSDCYYDVPKYDMIITNPPWNQNAEFIKHALEHGKPFAFLMKIETIGTAYMRDISKECGIIILPIYPRVKFMNEEGNATQVGNVAWFIFNLPIAGEISYDCQVIYDNIDADYDQEEEKEW